jgi:hypothetical protein
MKKEFTSGQKEIIARKLGYDGPMQGFDEFVRSSPALSARYNMVTDKYVQRMAKGGLTRNKFAAGGNVEQTDSQAPKKTDQGTERTMGTTFTDIGGVPMAGGAAQLTAEEIEVQQNELVGTGSLAANTATKAKADQITSTSTAAAPTKITAEKVSTDTVAPDVQKAMSGVKAAQGDVSKKAQVTAAQGKVSSQSIAKAGTVDEEFIQPITAEERVTGKEELVTAATEKLAPQAKAAQTKTPAQIKAAQGTVKKNELVKAAQIKDSDMAQAKAITAAGLAPDAVAVAARLEKFTVDEGTLAEAAQGNVDAQATVQGQLSELMKSFDDGQTPAWASGAIRAANAAMASRGVGGSSMAGAAIFQAAMESALPIASQDAQTFAQMGMQNLNNRQQTSLANAAAQQGLSLQNLNNEQQAALQNSSNSFALQSQNLSNMQQTMLANTQIRASLQGQNLSNQQQAAVVNAARYAEMNNINLNNVQQARLQDSANSLQVDLANLSNRQQTALANAQLQAALQNKNLDNKQQAAVLNAARFAENNNISFNAEQQAQLQNSELMKTIGLANLSASQATTLANAATYASMDMANLNNRQQAQVVNAQAFLQMDMANLSNQQQTTLFKAQQITSALLTDSAAENASRQFNASSQNQTNQFMTTMSSQVSQFNAAQKNAVAQFNVDQANAIVKLNAEAQNQRDEFNGKQRLVIDQANAQWRRDVSTANTAATNSANYLNAQNLQAMTVAEYNNETQLYRDQIQNSFDAYENESNRITNLAIATIEAKTQKSVAQTKTESDMWTSIGKWLAKI